MDDAISFVEENNEKIHLLKHKIIKAFSKVEQPAKDNIAPHDCNECKRVRKDFTAVKWQEASDELLEGNHGKLPLFSPQAFQYFLPAYLLHTLNNFDKELSEVCEFTLYALLPDKNWRKENREISSYWIEKLSLFSAAQMNCIYHFLDLARQNPIYRNTNGNAIERAFNRLKEIKSESERQKAN